MMIPTDDHRPHRFILYWRAVGGGSLTLSIALHVLLLAAAWLLICPDHKREPEVQFLPDNRNAGAENATRSLAHLVNFHRERQRDQMMKSERIMVPDGPVSIPATEVSFDPGRLAMSDEFFRQAMNGQGGKLVLRTCTSFNPASDGPVVPLPSLIRSRCSTVARLGKLKENGGSPQCEKAVSMALEWLKSKQNKDGSWGRSYKGAMSGFALLAYFGRCETPDSPFYGDEILNGLLFLIELSKTNPYGIFAGNPAAHSASYEHGIATCSLGEMYALARLGNRQLPGLSEAFQKGVRIIIDHQLSDGGWGYGESFCYRDTGSGDLSVTGWQFQALKAAKLSGLKMDGLHPAIEKAVRYIATRQTREGGFGGSNRETGYNQWNLTGVGLLGLQTLGGSGHHSEISRGMQFATNMFEKEPPSWGRNANLYAWYYYTQAFFQNRGKPWSRWNDAVLPELLAHQNREGSWNGETSDSAIAATGPAGADRELYRTALCTLILEVYYRYLKVGDREEGSIFVR